MALIRLTKVSCCFAFPYHDRLIIFVLACLAYAGFVLSPSPLFFSESSLSVLRLNVFIDPREGGGNFVQQKQNEPALS